MQFKSEVQQQYYEDLLKGTYVKGQTVHDYFQAYAQNSKQYGGGANQGDVV